MRPARSSSSRTRAARATCSGLAAVMCSVHDSRPPSGPGRVGVHRTKGTRSAVGSSIETRLLDAFLGRPNADEAHLRVRPR